jgi:hypothetical protein
LGFAVRGPAQRPASPRGHRPPDGDVLGRIHVGVFRMPASAAPIRFAGLQSGNRDPGAFAAVRVSLRACQSPPQSQQTLRLAVVKTGNRQHFAGRKCSRDDNAKVHTDDLSRTRTVHHRWDRAESNPADLRNPYLADLARQAAYVPVAAAPSDDAEPRVPSGLTPRRSAVRPCEGVAPWAPMRVLLHRKIPDKTGVRAVFQQYLFSRRGWLKPESHADTLLSATDIRGGSGPGSQVSAPRIR